MGGSRFCLALVLSSAPSAIILHACGAKHLKKRVVPITSRSNRGARAPEEAIVVPFSRRCCAGVVPQRRDEERIGGDIFYAPLRDEVEYRLPRTLPYQHVRPCNSCLGY